MSAQRLLQWLRALLRPAPLFGVAMIAVFWLGLFYLLADHHGSLATPEQRRALFLPVVIVLTLLELVVIAASIRRQVSIEETNLRFNTALENLTHGMCMFDDDKRLVVWNERYANLYRLPPELLKVGARTRTLSAIVSPTASSRARPAPARSTRSSARSKKCPRTRYRAGSMSLPTAGLFASPGSR